ncbi:HIT family protein [Patescibacteria group bacterium]|nr:HIT family protein [Patescibacteria group bacterium]MBU1727734.1 HIT family protein [Patescibacteria group bacterium]
MNKNNKDENSNGASCIFCKIIKGEIPCDKVYEDKDFFAFLDIKPVSDGHLLIIPKQHIVWIQEADDETVSNIFKLAKKLIIAIKKALECDYVQLSIVGKDVPHFHIHLFPRYFDDKLPMFPTKEYQGGKSKEVAQKIIQAL